MLVFFFDVVDSRLHHHTDPYLGFAVWLTMFSSFQ